MSKFSYYIKVFYDQRLKPVFFTALNLPSGKRTVMHLVPREKLPPLAADGELVNVKSLKFSLFKMQIRIHYCAVSSYLFLKKLSDLANQSTHFT